ncbi:MAG: hypothetical protein U5R14_12570 [Gemmatimonadota bacterium]|nr:hypothetical protein [Gemmatimonadota bacterium]
MSLQMGSPVRIPVGSATLEGDLVVSAQATGIVLFAHGSGSSRLSPRNRFVAHQLQEAGLGTLLFDLLTPAEETVDEQTREYRFDIELLARRLGHVTAWVTSQEEMKAEKAIEIVPGATHLFSEEGALERVAELAAEWFAKHLA